VVILFVILGKSKSYYENNFSEDKLDLDSKTIDLNFRKLFSIRDNYVDSNVENQVVKQSKVKYNLIKIRVL